MTDFPATKPRELLEVLVSHRGHRVSKIRLAALLWGDQPPRNDAASLETYVSVLRRTLRRLGDGNGAAVVTEPGGYRLGPGGIEVDLDLFDAAVREASGAVPTAALASLQRALTLVRGDVLEDAPDAPWAKALRDTYRDRHVAVLVDAGRLSLVTGDAAGARDLARRATALAPLSEPPYQVLMTAAYALGRQAEALQAFDRCRYLLAEKLAPTRSTGRSPSTWRSCATRPSLSSCPGSAPSCAVPPACRAGTAAGPAGAGAATGRLDAPAA